MPGAARAVRDAHVALTLGGVEALDRHHDGLAGLDPLADRGVQQLA